MTKTIHTAPDDTPSEAVSPTAPPDGFARATGTGNTGVQDHLLMQLSNALCLPDGLDEAATALRVQAAFDCLQEIGPADVAEGHLAAQMIATHEAAMECLRRAMMQGQSPESRNQELKHAGKLLGLYVRQIEALDKRRGKGQQKMIVEHVHVEAGAQAIVGPVEAGPRTRAPRR